MLTSFSSLTSNNLISFTPISPTMAENIASTSSPSTYVFNGSQYPFVFDMTPTVSNLSPAPTITIISTFVTFPDSLIYIPYPSAFPHLFTLDAPCSIGASSFSYVINPSTLPQGITFSPTSTSSSQTFVMNSNVLGASNLVSYTGQI